MSRTAAEKVPAWLGLLATGFAGIASQVVGGMVMLAAALVFAVKLAPDDPPPFLWVALSTVALQGMLLLVAVLTPLLARVRVGDALGLKKPAPALLLLAPLGAVALGPVADLFMQGAASVVGEGFGTVGWILAMARANPWWLTLPVIALLPGFAEEFLFRGLLQRSLGNGVLAWVVASLAFALFHLDPVHVAGVLPVAFYLGWLFQRSRSLWVTVSAHVGNNAFAVVAANIEVLNVGHGTDKPVPSGWVLGSTLLWVLIVAVCGWLTRNRSKPGQLPEDRR